MYSYFLHPRNGITPAIAACQRRDRRWGLLIGLVYLLTIGTGAPAQAQLAEDSVLSLSSQGVGKLPERKITIELAETGETVFRSSATGKVTPVEQGGRRITFNADQEKLVSVMPSSTGPFGNAYADTTTTIQDLPLDESGKFDGVIPNFIRNIWLKTPGGGRVPVSFTLFSVAYDAVSGAGTIQGVFVEADARQTEAAGTFQIRDTAGCACNYTLQLRVSKQLSGPPSVMPPDTVAVSPQGGGGSGGGGFIASIFPLAIAALASGDNDRSPTSIAGTPNATENPVTSEAEEPETPTGNRQPTGNRPPTGNRQPTENPIPTPALLPGAIAFALKTRQRWQQQNPQ